MNIVGVILVAIGLFLCFSAILGYLRFRTFFDQFHSAGIVDTIGSMCFIFGLICFTEFSIFSMKGLLLIGLVFIISPLNTHLLANAAFKASMLEKKVK